jgi:hypothetical protein
MDTSYEWDWEEVDTHGDILDHNFSDKLKSQPEPDNALTHYELVLVYNRGDDVEGIVDRSWAYVQDGKLPETFQNGIKVPKRFHEEIRKH